MTGLRERLDPKARQRWRAFGFSGYSPCMATYQLEDLEFVVDDDSNGRSGTAYLTAHAGGREVGHLTVVYDADFEGGVAQVSGIESTAGRGGRVGTRMYEFAARYFCEKNGLRLSSDGVRSEMAEGFWRKQYDKGRADFFRILPTASGVMRRAHPDKTDSQRYDTRYTLKTCPPPENLDGLRRRR